MDLMQQFEDRIGEFYQPIPFSYETEGYVVSALRGPDDNSMIPKFLGTCIIRHALQFEYGMNSNPIRVRIITESIMEELRTGKSIAGFKTTWRMKELEDVQRHYASHMTRAFSRLKDMTPNQDRTYYSILANLWECLADKDMTSAKDYLEALWKFLEDAKHRNWNQ